MGWHWTKPRYPGVTHVPRTPPKTVFVGRPNISLVGSMRPNRPASLGPAGQRVSEQIRVWEEPCQALPSRAPAGVSRVLQVSLFATGCRSAQLSRGGFTFAEPQVAPSEMVGSTPAPVVSNNKVLNEMCTNGTQPSSRTKKVLKPAMVSAMARPRLQAALKAQADLEARKMPRRTGKWTESEDEELVRAVWLAENVLEEQQEPQTRISWTAIAAHVEGRGPKQCRERWCNQLQPGLNLYGEWSAEEDATLVELVELHGTKWSHVGRLLQTKRPDNLVKNRYLKLERAGLAGGKVSDALADLLGDDGTGLEADWAQDMGGSS